MQTLPPPRRYHCVKAADASSATVRMLLTASGNLAQVEAWLAEVRRHALWKIDADTQANAIRFSEAERPSGATLRGNRRLIYYGQLRHLSGAVGAEPPICETAEQ